MQWQAWSQRLTEVLELKRTPVAVTYTDTPPEGASTDKRRVCGALMDASNGTVVDLTAQNSTCGGGSQYLGLRSNTPEAQRVLREFLIDGEKLLASPAAIHRMTALSKVQPPFGMADHVIFSPLNRAELKPDLAVFICNAFQACRLVHLAYYETGIPMECDPTGALCKSVICYPLVSGRLNISFGDITARKFWKYAEDELFVSAPYEVLRSMIASIDHCSAGTAKTEIPPAMRELMRRGGGDVPEL